MYIFGDNNVGLRTSLGVRGRAKAVSLATLILCLCWCCCQSAQAQANDGLWETYMEAGRKAHRDKNYDEAERLYKLAGVKARAFGELDERHVNTLANLVGLYVSRKKNAEADASYKQLLSILEKGAGEKSPNSASIVRSLAGLFNTERRYKEAEPLYKHALAIYRRVMEPGDTKVSLFIHFLGNNYYSQGKYKEAEEAFKEELGILERDPVLGKEMNVTYTLGYLGLIAQRSQRYDEAEKYMVRALDVVKSLRGETHPETASMLKALGLVYRRQESRYGDAIKVMQRALQIDEAVYGKTSKEVASDLDFLAGVHRAQANYEEAAPLLARALDMLEGIPTIEPAELSTIASNLADAYVGQLNYAEGEATCKRLRGLFEKRSQAGPENDLRVNNCLRTVYFESGDYVAEAETLKSLVADGEKSGPQAEAALAGHLSLLGNSYIRQRKYDEAYAVLQRAEQLYVKSSSTPEAHFLHFKARYYYFTGRYAESEPFFAKAVELAEQKRDVESEQDAAFYRKGHALALYAQGKTAQAAEMFGKAVDKLKANKISGGRDISTSLHELATLLAAQGKYAEAGPLFERAVAMREKAMGADHPEVAASLEGYAGMLRKAGRAGEAAPLEGRARAIRAKRPAR